MKLPIGLMTQDKIKRSNLVLTELSKILSKVPETDKKERERQEKVLDLTEAFYQIIPYDFGMKKPMSIDHLLRVKQKAKAIAIANDICITEQVLKNILVSLVFLKSLCSLSLQSFIIDGY